MSERFYFALARFPMDPWPQADQTKVRTHLEGSSRRGDEDAEGVAGRIRIDPQRLLRIV